MRIAVGLRQKVASLTEKPEELGKVDPGASLWLPVVRSEPGIVCLKPCGKHSLHITSYIIIL